MIKYNILPKIIYLLYTKISHKKESLLVISKQNELVRGMNGIIYIKSKSFND